MKIRRSIFWIAAWALVLACNPKKEDPVPVPEPVPEPVPTVIAVESITLDKAELTLIEGDEADLKASVLPDNATDPTVTWSSSDSLVVAVAGGKVKALVPGKATIKAQAGEKVDSCIVTVEKRFIEVTSVSLDEHTLTLIEGDEADLKAAVLPEDATDPTVSWSTSDSLVVTVADGKVKALVPGNAVIKAQAGEQVDSCIVSVEKRFIEVTSVTLNEHSLTLVEGDETTLTATVLPDDATEPAVTWTTSDASVATVTDGKVKTLKPGKVTITALAGEKSDACEITVEKRFIAVTSVTLDEHTLTLVEGDEATLSATVKPDDATEPSVTWSTSDESVATVTDGKVKALKPGNATITAKAGEKSDACEVTVEKLLVAVTSVELSEHSLILVEGEEATLSATVKPDDATDKTVAWSTSDASVATVADGEVKTLKPGKATITAKAGEKSDACEITVEKRFIPVSSVILNEHSLTLTEGDETTLTATVKPDDATDPSVTWTTSDAAVATVTDGKVKTLKPGKVTITAKAGEKSDACEITVEKIFVAVASVALSQSELTLLLGESATLSATVHPDDATDKTVTWSSSDESVASVSGGRVLGLKEGVATITAESGGKSASCKVTVEYQFSISPRQVTASGDGHEFSVRVVCPESYQVETVPAWITQLSVSGKTHKFKAERNPAKTQRSDAIVFLDGRGTRLSCTVTQGGHTTDYVEGQMEQIGEGSSLVLGAVQTKASLSPADGGAFNLLWSTNDKIGVYMDGGSSPVTFSLTQGAGSRQATFSGDGMGTSYLAVYPQSAFTSRNGLTLPLEQTYKKDDLAEGIYPMVAAASSAVFQFRNLCSVIRISLTGTQTVTRIVFRSAVSSVKVSGNATVNITNPDAPVLTMAADASDSVTLRTGGVTLKKDTPTYFYLVIPAQTYTGGFTLGIYADGIYMESVYGSSFTAVRSQMHKATNIALESYNDDGNEEPVEGEEIDL